MLGHEPRDLVVRDHIDLVDQRRRPIAIEEMHERDPRLERGEMGDEGEIHAFLDGVRAELSKACLPASHHVRVIIEDGQRVLGDRAGRYVKYAWQGFARDEVEVG